MTTIASSQRLFKSLQEDLRATTLRDRSAAVASLSSHLSSTPLKILHPSLSSEKGSNKSNSNNNAPDLLRDYILDLFSLIRTERDYYFKKPTSQPAEKRLVESVSVLKLFVEKYVQKFGRVRSLELAKFCLKMLVVKDEVWKTTAKELVGIWQVLWGDTGNSNSGIGIGTSGVGLASGLGSGGYSSSSICQAHLAHLPPETWESVVGILWADILDDFPVRGALDEKEEDLDELINTTSGRGKKGKKRAAVLRTAGGITPTKKGKGKGAEKDKKKKGKGKGKGKEKEKPKRKKKSGVVDSDGDLDMSDYEPSEEDSEDGDGSHDEEEDLPSTSTRRIQSPLNSSAEAANGARARSSTPQQKLPRTASPLNISELSLISTLFSSPTAPLLELAIPILIRFIRFFRLYPDETTAHLHAVTALNQFLSELEVNNRSLMIIASKELWKPLVRFWTGTKNVVLKEQLIISVRYLWNFGVGITKVGGEMGGGGSGLGSVNGEEEGEEAEAERAQALLEAVIAEADSGRWKNNDLDLECLRLGLWQKEKPHNSEIDESSHEHDNDMGRDRVAEAQAHLGNGAPFDGLTIRHGNAFGFGQALAWAMLELGADCLHALYLASEKVMDSGRGLGMGMNLDAPSGGVLGKRKRSRQIENPINTLLGSVRLGSGATTIRLQLLLFFIERHWASLHAELQREVVKSLISVISLDTNSSITSWAFLGLGAIAYFGIPPIEVATQLRAQSPTKRSHRHGFQSESRSGSKATLNEWEQVWNVALRKMNNSALCRSACHTALILFREDRVDRTKVGEAIETLGKDLEVQGPAFPSSSVCDFLTRLVKISSSDVQLSSQKLPDKIVGWLSNSWLPFDGISRNVSFNGVTRQGGSGLTNSRARQDPFDTAAMLELFATVCGLKRAPSISTTFLIPDCPISRAMSQQQSTSIIRNYILHARLPAYHPPSQKPLSSQTSRSNTSSNAPDLPSQEPGIPTVLQRKVSALMERCLESSFGETDEPQASFWQSLTAERARRTIDLATLALTYEAMLELNGIFCARRNVASASRILTSIAPHLLQPRWTGPERSFVLNGLTPLFLTTDLEGTPLYTGLVEPGRLSDIRRHLIPESIAPFSNREDPMLASLLQRVWMTSESHEVFTTFTPVFASLLGSQDSESQARDVDNEDDDNDEFGPIRSTQAASRTARGNVQNAPNTSLSCASIAVRGLVSMNKLRQNRIQPVEVPQIVDVLAREDPASFLVVGALAFEAVLSGHLKFSLDDALTALDNFQLLATYEFRKSSPLKILLVRFMECTLPIWTSQDRRKEGPDLWDEFKELAGGICDDLTKRHVEGGEPWQVRLQFTVFMDNYLAVDPHQQNWGKGGYRDSQGRPFIPSIVLAAMLADSDLRIRFRISSSAARLFYLFHSLGERTIDLTDDIENRLPKDTTNFEGTLTRILGVANLLIACRGDRRGAYCNLLQIAGESDSYVLYAEAALKGVTERLALPSLAGLHQLFVSYAADIRQRDPTGPVAPERLVGYGTKKEYAEATFVQAGTALWGVPIGLPDDPSFPKKDEFDKLCKLVGKTTSEGLLRCMGPIVARLLLRHFENGSPDKVLLEAQLQDLVNQSDLSNLTVSAEPLECVADSVGFALLSSFHEDDISSQGTWPDHLKTERSKGYLRYLLINIPKSPLTHQECLLEYPGIGVAGAEVVVPALLWFSERYHIFDRPSTLHSVLHQLLTRVASSPLVQDQLRILAALAVCVAISEEKVGEPKILGLIMRGLTSLLAQPDIFFYCQSLISWVHTAYFSRSQVPPNIHSAPDYILKAARINWEMSRGGYPEIRPLALSSFERLDKSVRRVLESSKSDALFKESLHDAVLLWPRPIVDQTNDIESVRSTLFSSAVQHGKFGLVRFLKDANCEESEKARLLWRLLPEFSNANVSPDDALALCDALYATRGALNPPRIGDPDYIHRDLVIHLGDPAERFGDFHVRVAIILNLSNLLHHGDLEVVDLAHQTLRLLFSSSQADAPGLKSKAARAITSITDPNIWKSETKRSRLDAPPTPFFEISVLADPVLAKNYLSRSARGDRSLAELEEDDWIKLGRSYSKWIHRFTRLLADVRASASEDPVDYYAQLNLVLQRDEWFASQSLPLLIHSLLLYELNCGEDSLLTPRGRLSRYFQRLIETERTDTATIRAVVEIVVYLRHFPRRLPKMNADPRSNDKWLDVPWLVLAQGAVLSQSSPAALLFLELAHEHDGILQSAGDPAAPSASEGVDRTAQSVFYDLYANLDEPDGFYGLHSSNLRESLQRRYHHEGQWTKTFELHGADYESLGTRQSGTLIDGSKSTTGVVESLASFGFNRLAQSTLQSSRALGFVHEGDVPVEKPYELAWRTGTWDLPVESRAAKTSPAALYDALKAVHVDRDPSRVKACIEHKLLQETQKLSTVTVENAVADSSALLTLLSLREIFQWSNLGSWNDLIASDAAKPIGKLSQEFNFQQGEQILSTRISLLRSIRAREQAVRIGDESSELCDTVTDLERQCLLDLSKRARAGDQRQSAWNAITRALDLKTDRASELELPIREEFAHVLWLRGEYATAIEALRGVHDELKAFVDKNVKGGYLTAGNLAVTFATLGDWNAEARLLSREDLKSKWFDPAVNYADKCKNDDPADRGNVFFKYASFADKQFQDIVSSPEYIRLKERRARIEALTNASSSQNSKRSKRSTEQKALEKHLLDEQKAIGGWEDDRKVMLLKALEMFARALELSDKFDDCVYRFCSLWMEQSSSEHLNKALKDKNIFHRLPSHKFALLAYQLSARLSDDPTSSSLFQENLMRLFTRLCAEHPFHSLYQVWSLYHSGGLASKKSSRNSLTPTSRDSAASQTRRAQAAEKILTKVKSIKNLAPWVIGIENACVAYVQFAKLSVSKEDQKDKRAKKVPPSFALGKLNNVGIPITTIELPIDLTGNYSGSSYPLIDKYQRTFNVAGGIHAPKIIDCVAHNGSKHTQLFKAEDDTRQDAVMEQVFHLASNILMKDSETRRRSLRFRTYKVVPLTHDTGVIQFVGNTSSLGDLLKDLHTRYRRPNEWGFREATLKFQEAQEKERRKEDSYESRSLPVFREAMSKMSPVMRHAFFESQRLPSGWFGMRLNYSRSVATTSIVGWVLGLGDRHLSNILVDIRNGEVVHIDLGIAFDAGASLPIPERVPFRLTREMVDGFGMTGVEGVFRRCCEEILRVLREQANVIVTVLEVFKFDPLQKWSVSSEKIRQQLITLANAGNIASTGSEFGGPASTAASSIAGGEVGPSGLGDFESILDIADEADRALNAVKEKLKGGGLSVQYNVNGLIGEARKETNLARMYQGWSPIA